MRGRFPPSEAKTRDDAVHWGESSMNLRLPSGSKAEVSQGVGGMKLQTGDRVVGMIVTDDFDTSVPVRFLKHGMAAQ